jgi:Restriction endonuclease BglII
VKIRIAESYSYRHADAILASTFPHERQEIVAALTQTDWVPIDPPKERRRKGKVVATLSIEQKGTNSAIEATFHALGWAVHPRIISSSTSNLASDYRKGKIQVEVQLGNMARWYTDVFKFLLSYSADDIEIGVLAVPMQAVAAKIDENIAHYERVVRELPHAKMGITLPIWVLGLG